MLDLNWQAWTANLVADTARFQVLGTTEPFDHCVFTVLDGFDRDRERKWLDVLFSMDYANPDHREMMDLEGLKAWRPGRTSGSVPWAGPCRRCGSSNGGIRGSSARGVDSGRRDLTQCRPELTHDVSRPESAGRTSSTIETLDTAPGRRFGGDTGCQTTQLQDVVVGVDVEVARGGSVHGIE